MDTTEIGYIFSAGFRCYSTDVLKQSGLRPFSGPFDYLYIDIETVFKLMNKKMSLFLNDIVIYNKVKQQTYCIDSLNELNEKHVCYMAHDYNSVDLRINTNFLDDTLSGNIYDWEKICIFHHHDISNKHQYDIIKNRVDRFNKIIEQHSDKTVLFHITKIQTFNDIQEYINNILRLKELYSINTYIIIIVCCDKLEDTYYFREKVLFIVKKVAPYNTQLLQNQVDNNCIDCTRELNIMKTFFVFKLVQLREM